MFLTFVAPRTSGWQCNLMRAPPGGDACWLGRCQGNRNGNGRGTRESICQHSWRWRRRAKPKLPVECVFDCPLAASQSNFSCNSNSESCSSPASASAQQLLSIMACDPHPPTIYLCSAPASAAARFLQLPRAKSHFRAIGLVRWLPKQSHIHTHTHTHMLA